MKLIKSEEKKKNMEASIKKDKSGPKGVSVDHQALSDYHRFKSTVGIKANKLQKHFREQIL